MGSRSASSWSPLGFPICALFDIIPLDLWFHVRYFQRVKKYLKDGMMREGGENPSLTGNCKWVFSMHYAIRKNTWEGASRRQSEARIPHPIRGRVTSRYESRSNANQHHPPPVIREVLFYKEYSRRDRGHPCPHFPSSYVQSRKAWSYWKNP